MTVHIAGLALRVGNLVRQRCAWCGDMLIDDNLELMASPDGEWEPRVFELNALIDVRVSDSVRQQTVVAPQNGELPPTCCTKGRPGLRLVTAEGVSG